jgi:hypothetical protein
MGYVMMDVGEMERYSSLQELEDIFLAIYMLAASAMHARFLD